MFSEITNKIFQEAIEKYHEIGKVDQEFHNPYDADDQLIEHLLYRKCWIDTTQWDYEDLIRDPDIDPVAALKPNRKINKQNKNVTITENIITSNFLKKNKEEKLRPKTKTNTKVRHG